MSNNHGHVIRTAAAARAIVAPLRQEIVDALDAAGPCSIARLAELLGRPADSLYFHLRKLERVGLVIETERRREGRHVFRVYDVPAHPVSLRYGEPIRAADLSGIARSAFRAASKEFSQAARDPEIVTEPGPRRALWMGRAKGWLTERELAQANTLLGELLALVRAANARGGQRDGARLFGVTFGLAPVPVVLRGTPKRAATQRGPRRKKGAS
ncbi:MAG TPA: helix-turn-helix domain-containing protein [Phycisphaerales bacterium]